MFSMKNAAMIFAAILLAAPAWAAEYSWPIVRIVDGDTGRVDSSADMPPELAALSVRLRGVDTPEQGGRAKCLSEREAGQATTAFTNAALAGANRVVVRDPGWDKWGGRVIAELILDGKPLSETLIVAGHGRPMSAVDAVAGANRADR